MARAHFGFGEPDRKRGKRLRPQILLLVAEQEGARRGDADGAAIAIELLHNYSLIHDDIEDGDELRHGRPTLWVRFGIPSAIVAGNAMCAMSYLALVTGQPPDVPPERQVAMERCLQRANLKMCEGQSFDIGFETAQFVTFDEYVNMIDGKTCALFSAACELGARAAGCDEERALAYAAFGRAYGKAFQIRDDILGTWGTTAQTGKPSGADIRRRKWSFPVVWALDGAPSADRDLIAEAYTHVGSLSDATATAVIAALDRLGAQAAADRACDAAIAEAEALAARYELDKDGRLRSLFNSTSRRTA
jgi:geranylgeranyl diphosphate synthase type I